MATVLSQTQSQTNNIDKSSMKTNLLQQFQSIYKEIINQVDKQTKDSVSSQLFHNYHEQISGLISSSEVFRQDSQQKSESQIRSSSGSQDSNQKQKILEQPSYLFLRNVWLGKNQQNIIPLTTYDPQDHIDKINKAVAMIRQQTVYMTKKQNYLYEKQDSNYTLLNENPFFIRVKQQLQKMKMQNQQLRQKCHYQSQMIQKLNKDKLLLQNSLRSYKKKFQQMEKSWIEVSKKNICLQQESLVLKSQNSRSRLNMMRESGDYTNIELKQSVVMNTSTISHRKLTQDIISQNLTSVNKTTNLTNSISTDILRPLDNVFIDIKLKQNQHSPKLYSNRYGKMNSQNQQSQSQKDYLKDVTIKINSNNNNSSNENNQQQLLLSHSDQLIAEVTTLKFRNIRNQTSARKTLLLSSARSVDLNSKTSLNKPKFQRTKPNNNLQQNLLKSVSNKSIDINIQKPKIVKNQFITNQQTTNLVKSFRNQPRTFLSRREQVK